MPRQRAAAAGGGSGGGWEVVQRGDLRNLLRNGSSDKLIVLEPWRQCAGTENLVPAQLLAGRQACVLAAI